MARILLTGTGPILESGAKVMSGQCLRTWHFAAPLLEDGHDLCLITVPIPGATRDEAEPPVEEAVYRGFTYRRLLSNDPARILPLINRTVREFRPDALVGVNPYPAWLMACIDSDRPLWADLNGWTMAEGQVRAAVMGHDRDFAHFWKLEATTILRADRFSTVTRRQADALYGEMAMVGRLSHLNFAEELAVDVPNAVYPDYAALDRRRDWPEELRGRIRDDATVCLWSGGFNSWTDIDLLTGAMGKAMEAAPNLYFVCTGGPVIGHDEETYRQFEEFSAKRLPPERCLPLGWVGFESVLKLHAAASFGLNIDGINTETRFGARNRLTNMMGAGLPVLTTRGTEIAEWIERHDLGTVVSPRDHGALTAAIVDAVKNPAAWESRAATARQRALEEFAPRATLAAFLGWAAKPRHAPDFRAPSGGDSPAARLRDWCHGQAAAQVPFASVDANDANRRTSGASQSGVFRKAMDYLKKGSG